MLMTPTGRRPSVLAVWVALVTVYLVWGSTYLAIRVVVETVPPLLAMGARFLLAGLLLGALIAIRRGLRTLLVPPRRIGAAATVGALLLLGGNGGVAIAEQTVPSGIAALLVAATPLWLVCLRFAARDRPAPLSLLGTVVGFVGIAVLVRPGASLGDGVQTWGLITVVGAAASWALGSFLSSRIPLPADAFVATTWEMVTGGLALLLVGLVAGEGGELAVGDIAGEAWAWLVYLVLIGSIVAFSAYVWLLQNAPISLTATYAYVNPVVAVALGALVLAEPITAAVVMGGAVVVLGVGLVVTAERPRRQHDEPTDQPTDESPDDRPGPPLDGRVAPDERVVDLPT